MLHVPEHILDLVANYAKAYPVESEDRWLAGYPPEKQKDRGCTRLANVIRLVYEDNPLQIIEESAVKAA
jgi:hypothetical protein